MRRLKWGETPWDQLTQKDLLREVQRVFLALESTRPALRLLRHIDIERYGDSPFWQQEGCGGKALDQASQVIDSIYQEYDAESVYRSFFRYAASLLFEVPQSERWVICPLCGSMWSGETVAHYVGTLCSVSITIGRTQESQCEGVLRWLTWEDLAKKEEEKEEGNENSDCQ